jgi:aspartate kinase
MSTSVRVLKFGGTSVKSMARIQHVAEIIEDYCQKGPIVVVVSAMGDMTDYLVKLAKQCTNSPDSRELDLLLSTGEQISIALLSMTLRDRGITARSFTGQQVGIFTENVHNNARIVEIKKETLERALQEYKVVVVAGFQGVTPDGDITTLGRGGSDTTAVALSAAIGASVCDIYTDVDGIFTADPNKIKNARLLESITYEEVLEMARMGAQVIHPRAVELGRQYGVTIRVRNTFKPEHRGTLIQGGFDEMELFRTVSGIAVDKDQACVAITELPDRPGVAAKITRVLADEKILMDVFMQSFHPSIGLTNITFTVPEANLEPTIACLENLKAKMGGNQVLADADIAKVSLIGVGFGGQPEIAARLFAVMGDAGINIKMISSTETKITCVVSRDDADRAASLIHDAFELGAVEACATV